MNLYTFANVLINGVHTSVTVSAPSLNASLGVLLNSYPGCLGSITLTRTVPL